MSNEKKDVQMLQSILDLLVSNPKAIKIDRKIDELGVLISFDVAPEDRGMVIGKKGSTISAMRQLISVIGYQNKSKVHLKFLAPPLEARVSEKRSTLDDLKI